MTLRLMILMLVLSVLVLGELGYADECKDLNADINTHWATFMEDFGKNPNQDATSATQLNNLCVQFAAKKCTEGSTYYNKPLRAECDKLVAETLEARKTKVEKLLESFAVVCPKGLPF